VIVWIYALVLFVIAGKIFNTVADAFAGRGIALSRARRLTGKGAVVVGIVLLPVGLFLALLGLGMLAQ
jgi:hypothetical protein